MPVTISKATVGISNKYNLFLNNLQIFFLFEVMMETNDEERSASEMNISAETIKDINLSAADILPIPPKPIVPIVCISDPEEVQKQIESESCDESDCSLIAQDLEDVREDYNNWTEVFNNILLRVRPEIAMWERAEKLVFEKLLQSDNSAEVNSPATMLLRDRPQEDFQCFTLSKAMAFIRNKISSLRASLRKVECDCRYVKFQREKIDLIEKCLEKKKKFLEDKKRDSASETERAEFEKFMSKLKADDAMLKQMRNNIDIQLKELKSRRDSSGSSTEELRTQVEDLLKKLSSKKMKDRSKNPSVKSIIKNRKNLKIREEEEQARILHLKQKRKEQIAKLRQTIRAGTLSKGQKLELERQKYFLLKKNSGMAWYITLKDVPEIRSFSSEDIIPRVEGKFRQGNHEEPMSDEPPHFEQLADSPKEFKVFSPEQYIESDNGGKINPKVNKLENKEELTLVKSPNNKCNNPKTPSDVDSSLENEDTKHVADQNLEEFDSEKESKKADLSLDEILKMITSFKLSD